MVLRAVLSRCGKARRVSQHAGDRRTRSDARSAECVASHDVCSLDDARGPGLRSAPEWGASDEFYSDVSWVSEGVLAEIDLRAASLIDRYGQYVHAELREAERSRGEYSLDLLMLGLALGRYAGAADSTPGWVVALAHELFWLRREAPHTKSLADLGRAALIRFFLAPRMGRGTRTGQAQLNRLPRLIDWLQATGEFEQEVRRLNNWRSFLGAMAPGDADGAMSLSVEIFDWFEREAATALGAYTQGVPAFLAGEYAHRGLREDQIFCGRQPAEYHLAMVASEVMNQGLRAQFDRTAHKAVLVPACMRGPRATTCRAHVFGVDITCAGCDAGCPINRITHRMRLLGATVYLVPHSSGFSRWLERWQRQPDTGVLAVACLLNILPGGYEMRARRIPSQCIPLDFPGCQKHWRTKGIATGLNEDRLEQVMAAPNQD